MSKPQEPVTLPEPPSNSYLQSEVASRTKLDFHGNVWTLRYRSWTVTIHGEGTKECLAYCFYTPTGEAKFSRVVFCDQEGDVYEEMKKYFEWWVFSYDSKILEVDIEPAEKEEIPPKVKRLTGRRNPAKAAS